MKIIIVMIFTKIIDVPSAFTYPWLRPHMARGACDAVEDDRGLHWPWRVEDSFKTPNPHLIPQPPRMGRRGGSSGSVTT